MGARDTGTSGMTPLRVCLKALLTRFTLGVCTWSGGSKTTHSGETYRGFMQ